MPRCRAEPVLVPHNLGRACGLLHEGPRGEEFTSSASSWTAGDPPGSAAFPHHGRSSPLIGCRAQLRTADGEFVNDLDSPRSGGRVFTPNSVPVCPAEGRFVVSHFRKVKKNDQK